MNFVEYVMSRRGRCLRNSGGFVNAFSSNEQFEYPKIINLPEQ